MTLRCKPRSATLILTANVAARSASHSQLRKKTWRCSSPAMVREAFRRTRERRIDNSRPRQTLKEELVRWPFSVSHTSPVVLPVMEPARNEEKADETINMVEIVEADDTFVVLSQPSTREPKSRANDRAVAPHLWRIHGRDYDLRNFVDHHPGEFTCVRVCA